MRSASLRVLVVEDHRDTREILGLFLGILEHRVELAPDVDAALAKAQAREFDVLITDVQLSGREGWELIQELQAGGQLPPFVISMSAGDDFEQATRSKAAGCRAHLVKPFDCHRLEELLQSAEQSPPS